MIRSARFRELAAHLDAGRAHLLSLLDGVDAARAARRPAAGAWSPAEIVEHLRLVEATVAKLLHAMLDRADLASLGPADDETSILGVLDRFRITDRRRLVQAPERLHPAPGVALAPALEGLAAARARLLEALARADGLAVDALAAPHPILGTLTFPQWAVFVAQHESRHAVQLADALRPGDPAA